MNRGRNLECVTGALNKKITTLGSIWVNTDEIYMPMFHKPLSLFGRGYTFRYRVLYLGFSSLYPATSEQRIYGSEIRQLSKNACDPISG